MTKEHASSKQRRKLDNGKSQYIKPGALAQFCIKKISTRPCADACKKIVTRSCTNISKKRIVLDSKKTEAQVFGCNSSPSQTPKKLFLSSTECLDALKENKQPKTPKTPENPEFISQSRLESLPLELLVHICCYLHHDQLKAVFHVSQRIREAVLISIKHHFNYTTPDRSRQEMLRTRTPLPSERWPFRSNHGDMVVRGGRSPCTPKAPRHAPRPTRSKQIDMKQIAAVLFKDPMMSSKKSKCPPGLPRPHCKPSASNRVLFHEEDLCHAVAQNKLH